MAEDPDIGFEYDPGALPEPSDLGAVDADLVVDLASVSGLYERQLQWVINDAHFSMMLGGVGSGKSHALAWRCILRMMRNPCVEGALLGRTGIDLATVLLPHLFSHLDALQSATGISWIKDYNRGQGCITLINGGKCWFRPYNRIAKVRGLNLAWAMADETEWSEADPNEVFSVFTARVRVRCPWPGLDFVSSPNGLHGITKIFHEAQQTYQVAANKGDAVEMAKWERFFVVTVTSMDNPYLPDTYLEALGTMSADRYKQEVLGIVLRSSATCYTITDEHVIDWRWQDHTELPLVLGVDWGSGSKGHHYAALAQVEDSGRWVWFAETTLDGTPIGHWKRHLIGWLKTFGKQPELAGCDRARPQENNWLRGCLQSTQVAGMESLQEQKVTNGMEMVRDLLNPCDMDGNPTPPMMVFARSLETMAPTGNDTGPLLYSMRNLRYQMDSDGNSKRLVKKDDVTDHAADSLRYTVVASRNMPRLHGGQVLSMVGLGPVGDEDPRDLHPKSTRARY